MERIKMIRRFKLGKYHGFCIRLGIFKFERFGFKNAFTWRLELSFGWDK